MKIRQQFSKEQLHSAMQAAWKMPEKEYVILYTRKEVANHLGVNILTIRRWEKENKLKPHLYIGNKPRYTASSLKEIIKYDTGKH